MSKEYVLSRLRDFRQTFSTKEWAAETLKEMFDSIVNERVGHNFDDWPLDWKRAFAIVSKNPEGVEKYYPKFQIDLERAIAVLGGAEDSFENMTPSEVLEYLEPESQNTETYFHSGVGFVRPISNKETVSAGEAKSVKPEGTQTAGSNYVYMQEVPLTVSRVVEQTVAPDGSVEKQITLVLSGVYAKKGDHGMNFRLMLDETPEGYELNLTKAFLDDLSRLLGGRPFTKIILPKKSSEAGSECEAEEESEENQRATKVLEERLKKPLENLSE